MKRVSINVIKYDSPYIKDSTIFDLEFESSFTISKEIILVEKIEV